MIKKITAASKLRLRLNKSDIRQKLGLEMLFFRIPSTLFHSTSRSHKNAASPRAHKNSAGAVAGMLLGSIVVGTAFSSSATFAQETSTRFGMGGNTGQFGRARQQIGASGQEFRIEGHCQSACTMFLKLKNACVEPSAELLFHAGSNAQATQQMLNSYNGSLRSYLMANHYMDTPAFHTISGQDIIHKFGYRACKPK